MRTMQRLPREPLARISDPPTDPVGVQRHQVANELLAARAATTARHAHPAHVDDPADHVARLHRQPRATSALAVARARRNLHRRLPRPTAMPAPADRKDLTRLEHERPTRMPVPGMDHPVAAPATATDLRPHRHRRRRDIPPAVQDRAHNRRPNAARNAAARNSPEGTGRAVSGTGHPAASRSTTTSPTTRPARTTSARPTARSGLGTADETAERPCPDRPRNRNSPDLTATTTASNPANAAAFANPPVSTPNANAAASSRACSAGDNRNVSRGSTALPTASHPHDEIGTHVRHLPPEQDRPSASARRPESHMR